MAGGVTLAACSSIQDSGPPQASLPPVEPMAPALPANVIGTGTVRIGMILPLGASGNAALAAQSLRNAAELAMQEFTGANIQLIVKDDAGTAAHGDEPTRRVLHR